MESLVIIQERDQTRRELCEDCEHSRDEGLLLRCTLKRYRPCDHAAALRDRSARCPRNDEYAIIWQVAALDPLGRCADAPSAAATTDATREQAELTAPTSSIPPRGIEAPILVKHIPGQRPESGSTAKATGS